MKSSIRKQAERFLREQKNYKRWLAVFLCLAVVVTIGTTAALKYKGIAVTGDAEVSEEMHMEQAEAVSEELPPGMRRHVHTEACYEEQLVLVCEAAKAEAGETEAGGSADAAEPSDTGAASEPSKPADTTDAAQGHTHSDSCYQVTGGEETLTCTTEEHTHGDGCYETKTVTETVTKTVPETVTKEVTDEEGNVSTVTETVDKTVEETVEKEEKVLTCGKSEHSHGASCYTVEGGERTLVCGLEEGAGAESAAAESAAPETSAESAAPEAEAAAESAAPAAEAAAESTAPTAESTASDTADAAAGSEAPAVNAAAESTDTTAENTGADTAAENAGVENTAVESTPADTEGAENTENTEAAGETIDGHVHDDSCYELQMVLICGKEEGELEEYLLSDEMNLVQTAETENYSVTVTYSESAEIPEDAVLQVFEYAKDSEEYGRACEELGYQPDCLLDVGFYADGAEAEPKKPVVVKIIDKGATEAEGYEIGHFGKNGTEEIDSAGTKVGDGLETEFLLESFSPISVFKVRTSNGDPQITEVDPMGEIAREKYVEPVEGEKDTYNLTLNVKGAIGNSSEKANLDIVFVVDTSGSMGDAVASHGEGGNKSRRKAVNDEIEELVKELDKDSGIDARYKLVTFSNKASLEYANSWQSGSTLINRLPRNSSGGTNYEDAMIKAQTAVSGDQRDNTKRIIIFLTDGAPTYYNSGYSYAGHGSYTTATEVERAIAGAGNITSVCDYFFAVGFGADMVSDSDVGYSGQTAEEILTDVANATGAGKKSATATTNLTGYFDNFRKSLRTIRAIGVSFTDQLTNEVTLVVPEGKTADQAWERKIERKVVEIINPGTANETEKVTYVDVTNELGEDGKTELERSGMTVHYDEGEEKGLRVSFADDYELKTDYRYSVTAKIKTNNELTEPAYRANGYSYPHKGEAGTGDTSADKLGFFCNVEDSAKVNYNYMVGEERKPHDAVDYPRPVVQMADTPKPEPVKIQEMGHNKYVEKVVGDNDFYDLTLDITGEVATGKEQKPVKYDIMFVVDTSGSMADDVNGNSANKGKRRIDDVGRSINTLITQLAEKEIDAKYNMVTFASSATNTFSSWQNGSAVTTKIDLKTSGNTTYVNGLSASGGTNYQDAFVKAATGMTMTGARADAVKVVVFLTDGEPTYHLCNKVRHGLFLGDYCGGTNGNCVSNSGEPIDGGGSETYPADFKGAIAGAGALTGKADYFYAIGFGKDMTSNSVIYTDTDVRPNKTYTATQLLEAVRAATGIAGGETTATTDLAQYFTGMIETLIQYNCDHVTITDTLSQWAEVSASLNGAPAMMEIKVIDKNKEETDPSRIVKSAKVEGTENSVKITGLPATTATNKALSEADRWMEAKYNKEEKKVELKFNDAYQLEAGYTYAVTIRIKPSADAYEEMKSGSTENIHTGEEKTGPTSAGQTGFYSNATAKVTFTFKGETKDTDYARPVIQASTAEIIVTKTIEGLDNLTDEKLAEVYDGLRFTFDGKETSATGLTKNADGTYSITKKVVPGTYEVAELWEGADVDGHSRVTTVSVNGGEAQEIKTGKDENIKVSTGELKADSTVTVAFTNTYTAKTQTLKLKKVNAKDEISKDFENLEFTIRKDFTETQLSEMESAADKKAKFKEIMEGADAPEVVGTLTIGTDGYAVKTGTNEKEIVLPVGRYIVTEAETLANYLTVNPFIIEVRDGNVELGQVPGFSNDQDLGISDEQKDGTKSFYELTVKNRKIELSRLQIAKVNADGYAVLPGAEFKLEKIVNGKKESVKDKIELTDGKLLLTDDDGEPIRFEAGVEYILTETKAPDGFMIPESGFSFSVAGGKESDQKNNIAVLSPADTNRSFVAILKETENGGWTAVKPEEAQRQYSIDEDGNIVWTLAITNNTGAELPVTGGPGTAAYTFGGLAMIIAVSLMYGLNMRRKREKGGLN